MNRGRPGAFLNGLNPLAMRHREEVDRYIAPDRERAQHEAGHCAVAYLFKIPEFQVHYITIHPDSNGIAGGTLNVDMERANFEQWGCMLMAGVAAQMYGLRIRNKWDSDDPRVIDAWKLVWPQGLNDCREFMRRGGREEQIQGFLDQARQDVVAAWQLIEMLSFELMEQRIIYRDEFKLITRAYEEDRRFLWMLDLYRKHRREVEIVGDKSFDDFRANFPGVPWFESYGSFIQREGRSSGEDFHAWYQDKMGYPPLEEDED